MKRSLRGSRCEQPFCTVVECVRPDGRAADINSSALRINVQHCSAKTELSQRAGMILRMRCGHVVHSCLGGLNVIYATSTPMALFRRLVRNQAPPSQPSGCNAGRRRNRSYYRGPCGFIRRERCGWAYCTNA